MSISTNVITPDLQAKLDKAREEIDSGQCITLKSHDDIDKYFASLWFIQSLLPRVLKMSSRNGRNPIQSYSKKYQKIYHELVDHPGTVPGKFLAGM